VRNSKIFWIAARTFSEFERAYIKLGKDQNVPGIRDSGSEKLALVTEYLSDEDLGPWLLVFDGVDSLETPDVMRLKECIPESPVGAVLVTTSNHKIAGKLKERDEDTFQLMPFSEEELINFVRASLPKSRISDDDTCKLRDLTNRLPLSIAQAVAFLSKRPEVNAPEYLKSLSALQSRRASSEILATTQYSFDHINQIAPEVAHLARIASKFEFQSLPVPLLRKYDNRVDNFRRLMRDFAMITGPTYRKAFRVIPSC
jgi:hypothetical protein